MKEGQKYWYVDDYGEQHTRTWIGSILDYQRYFAGNVYSVHSGFSLVRENEMKDVWSKLDRRYQRNIEDQERYTSSPSLMEDVGSELFWLTPNGRTMQSLSNWFFECMPDNVLNDYVEGMDTITGEYYPEMY